MRLNRITNFLLEKDDVVSIRSGSGGGWGNPPERDPALVKRDILNGCITAEEAQKIHRLS
jgi:N-methylhydantoinase B